MTGIHSSGGWPHKVPVMRNFDDFSCYHPAQAVEQTVEMPVI